MTQRSTAFQADDSARAYQLAVVVLCALALLAAALALPPVSGLPPAGESTGSNGESDGDGTSGTGDPIEIQPGGTNRTGQPGDGQVLVNGSLDRECAVYVLDRPVPGSVVPVAVLRNGTAGTDVPVRFDGRLVGTTDERGVVTGEVPYQRELEVSVDVPAGVDCVFVDHDGEVRESLFTAVFATGLATNALAASQPAPDERGNYTVDGNVRIGVRGEPYPGDEVDVLAAVEGVPMAGADVAIDGEVVAETGADGQATVTVPNDGRETMTVRVRRGDFAGTRSVDLLVLRVGVAPSAPLALPGGEATTTATIGGDPVSDARVTVDDEMVGHTGADGRIEFTLPADPTTTVAVEGRDQRASTTLWPVYLPTIAVGLLYLGVLTVATWRDGVRGAVGVLAASGVVVGLALVGYGLLWNEPAVAVAGGVLAIAGAGVLFWQREHWRAATREGANDAGSFLARVVATVANLAYAAALALERFVLWAGDRLRDVLERLRSMPRSVRGLAAAVGAWLASVPARLLALVRWCLGSPRRLLAWWRDRGGEAATGADAESAEAQTEPAQSSADESFSLREAWRRFARRVVPGPWRQRTPGEVARAAIEAGFPSGSVGEFTDVFRDVEYGERSLTEERRERAAIAYESLTDHQLDEEAGD